MGVVRSVLRPVVTLPSFKVIGRPEVRQVEVYIRKCKQVNILPLRQRFILNDLIFLHKIVNELVPIHLPDYLKWFDGSTRLRNTHLDHRSLICTITPRRYSFKTLEKSFFYRTPSLWNSIPF